MVADIILFLLLAVAVVMIFAAFKKMSESPGSFLMPSPPARRTSVQRRKQEQELDDGDALAGLLVLLGVAWLGGKLLEKGFAYLKTVDWDEVSVGLRKAIEQAAVEVERQPNVAARLDRAEQLLMSGGDINLDQAAMLTSATLELGLRTLAQRERLVVGQDNDTLAGLAIQLGQAGYLAPTDQRQIQHYAARIRNSVMHGRDLGVMNAQEVREFHRLARRCLSAHRIA